MLYKRKESPHWQAEVTVSGTTVRKSTGTEDRKFAKAFEQKLIADLWQREKIGVTKVPLGDAINRYKRERPNALRDHAILNLMTAAKRGIAAGKVISEISKQEIRKYLDAVAEAQSNATANRTRNTMRALFNRAHEWGWLQSVPPFPAYQETKFEPKWITQDQFRALLSQLPPHAAAIARFAACTGLRYSNIAGFKWAWIQGTVAYIPASETKAGNAIPCVLSDDALALIAEQQGKHEVYVFPDDAGHAPIGSVKTCWRKAAQRAGLDGLRFHDLRHSWASWHLKQGTPLHVVQKLGGWSSYNMLLKVYGHFATDELAQYANKLKTGAK